MQFQRIGIYGVGLIGGSLGLAFKRFNPSLRILGIGRDPGRLKTARRLGAIDFWQIESGADFSGCDLIILATPVEHILSTLRTLGARLHPGSVVTDVGSTKRRICAEAWRYLPPDVEFIGGHPIAGREVAGVENCVEDLFKGAPYVICPRPGVPPRNLRRLRTLVTGSGARAWVLSPEEHDRTIAQLSHLPQLLSTALAHVSGKEKLGLAGGGFRDMTRLAGSSYAVWKSILATNADNIGRALDEFIEHLQRMRSDLKSADLSEEFSRAAQVRRRLLPRRR